MNQKIDFKKKFMAAIAMLLVSAMLLTSSTFAWLVLSTSPSIDGVTTRIGANGFLEIALNHGKAASLLGIERDSAVDIYFEEV